MKKNLLTIGLSALTATMLFTGCTNQPATSGAQSSYVNPELDGAPKWVLMPFVEGAVSSVGSAATNAGSDIGFQREEAMASGRDNLARLLGTKVKNMFKSFKASTGSAKDGTFDKSTESVSKQIAKQTLNGSRAQDMWISKSGTMYVLMVLDTQSVSQAMEKSIKTSYKNDKAMYQKFLAAKAQGELDAELEKVENE